MSLIVLPGAAGAAAGVAIDDAGAFADVLVAGAVAAEPAGELVAFLRAGDRFAPGKPERQAGALAAAPRAALCVTGHRRVDSDGRLLAETRPDPDGPLLVSGSVEISAVLARRSALPPVEDLLGLLQRPGGDVVLCAQLASEHAVATLAEPLVDVLLDPARHGTEPAHRVAELSTIVTSDPGRRAGPPSGLRRELLARLYLGRLHAEIAARDATIAWLHREVAARDALVAGHETTIAWLHREVAARDGEIERLRGGGRRPR